MKITRHQRLPPNPARLAAPSHSHFEDVRGRGWQPDGYVADPAATAFSKPITCYLLSALEQ